MRLDELRELFERNGHAVSVRDDVTPAAVAWFLECSEGTLANYRCQRKGPPSAKLPCGYRYSLIGLANWLDELQTKNCLTELHGSSRVAPGAV